MILGVFVCTIWHGGRDYVLLLFSALVFGTGVGIGSHFKREDVWGEIQSLAQSCVVLQREERSMNDV